MAAFCQAARLLIPCRSLSYNAGQQSAYERKRQCPISLPKPAASWRSPTASSPTKACIDAFGHVSMRHPGQSQPLSPVALARARTGHARTTSSNTTSNSQPLRDPGVGAIFRARDPRRNLQGAAGRDVGVPSSFARPSCRCSPPAPTMCRSSISARSAASSRRSGTSTTNSATPICWWSSRRRALRSRARSAQHWMVLMKRHGVTVAGTSVRDCVFRCDLSRRATPNSRCAP